ncbi:hypothetical protein [Spiroplasma ixodetis]|uniref:Uncharacterized protein n=1 Tax=Spiroplasma ixodetis TaxID=2141 RepID=A0ABM8BUI6_9MOLU|nr:hypothetical protein [Spiroplasma ixodetis]BDT03486.1 hypothetical protein SHM_11320 [Spiroplasma ixodetis]
MWGEVRINKIKGYYYSSGIERVRSKDLVGRWINFETNDSYFLTTNEQQKLISKFVSFTLEQDPYVKLKELELKLQKKIKKISNLKSKFVYRL